MKFKLLLIILLICSAGVSSVAQQKYSNLYFKGVKYYNNQQFDSALFYFYALEDTLERDSQIPSLYSVVTYKRIGDTYEEMSQYNTAFKYIRKAIRQKEEIDFQHPLIDNDLYNSLAIVYMNSTADSLALEIFKRIESNIPKDSLQLSLALKSNLALVYKRLGNLSKSHELLKQIESSIEDKNFNNPFYLNTRKRLANIRGLQGDFQKALNIYDSSLVYADPMDSIHVYFRLVEIAKTLDVELNSHYLQEFFSLLIKTDHPGIKAEGILLLSRYYVYRKRYKDAYHIYNSLWSKPQYSVFYDPDVVINELHNLYFHAVSKYYSGDTTDLRRVSELLENGIEWAKMLHLYQLLMVHPQLQAEKLAANEFRFNFFIEQAYQTYRQNSNKSWVNYILQFIQIKSKGGIQDYHFFRHLSADNPHLQEYFRNRDSLFYYTKDEGELKTITLHEKYINSLQKLHEQFPELIEKYLSSLILPLETIQKKIDSDVTIVAIDEVDGLIVVSVSKNSQKAKLFDSLKTYHKLYQSFKNNIISKKPGKSILIKLDSINNILSDSLGDILSTPNSTIAFFCNGKLRNYPLHIIKINNNYLGLQKNCVYINWNDKSLRNNKKEKMVIDVLSSPSGGLSSLPATSSLCNKSLSGRIINCINNLNNTKGDILHIAAHTYLDACSPPFSFIKLKDYNLYVKDIPRKDFFYNLIVLNSCNTTENKLFSSWGLTSLNQSFLENKCDQVISTLWDVDDKAAAYWAELFYNNLKSSKNIISTCEAARESSLKMQSHLNPHYSTLMSWAAYTHHVPISALYAEEDPTDLLWWFILIFIVFSGVLVWMKYRKQ